jgi:hypothetical protein
MGLIHNILKQTETKQLQNPMVQISTDRIQSKMEKQHMATIQRIEQKRQAKMTLTNKDKRDFRGAVNGLQKRGLAKIITSIEIEKPHETEKA